MKPNLKTLEDRVQRVVEHLRAVTTERDRLRGEIDPLREKLDTLEATAPSSPGAGPPGCSVPPDWIRSLEQVERVLEKAASELRGE